MSNNDVRFIRKNGRIIPIRENSGSSSKAAAGVTVAAAGVAYTQHRKLMGKKPLRSVAGSAIKSGAQKLSKNLAKLHKQTRFAHGALIGAGAITAIHQGTLKSNHPEVKVNQKLNLLGLGLSIGTGLLGAATFSRGAKGFIAGAAASHAIDAVGVGVNVASVAGKGHKFERAKQAAKQEARNFAIGNAVFAAGIVATKKNRETAISAVKATAKYAGKTLSFARKVLRVGAV